MALLGLFSNFQWVLAPSMTRSTSSTLTNKDCDGERPYEAENGCSDNLNVEKRRRADRLTDNNIAAQNREKMRDFSQHHACWCF